MQGNGMSGVKIGTWGTLLSVILLCLGVNSRALALTKSEIAKAQAVVKQAEEEEAAAQEAKDKAAKSAQAATPSDSDYEDRVDDLSSKVRTLSDLVGRTKILWSTHAYYRSSAVSPLTPTAYSDDAYVAAYIDVEKYFEKNFTGMLTMRVQKAFGADDSVSLDLLTGRLNYSLSWLRISVGRQSYAKFFTSNEFLGNMLTAGIHRMDAVTITIPLIFSTEVDDRGSYKSPPTAITYGYVPKLLSAQQNAVPSDIYNAGFHFGQLRMALGIDRWNVENTIKLNVGHGTTTLIGSSPLGDGLSYSATYDLTVAKDYSIFYEYGIQNSNKSSTSAMIAGGKMANLHEKWILIDEVVFETLFPGTQDPYNVLTGGNPQTFGVTAELPASEWYVRISNKIGKWELGGAATNSWGDYTFGRIRQGSLTTPLTTPAGPVNEIDGHAVSLLANKRTPLAFYIYSLYHF